MRDLMCFELDWFLVQFIFDVVLSSPQGDSGSPYVLVLYNGRSGTTEYVLVAINTFAYNQESKNICNIVYLHLDFNELCFSLL